MSNSTNNIQSQNTSATYERLYLVHRNVAQLDAPNQLNQLPEALRNQIFGQIYELAGRPRTNDRDWGRNNAFRDLRRLQTAIQNVAFNNFRAMPREQRNPIALRIWINGGQQQGDPNWGENHANDDVDRLFRSIIEGMGGTTSSSSSPSSGTQSAPSRSTNNDNRANNRPEVRPQSGFSQGDYADDDNAFERIMHTLSQTPNLASSTTQTTTRPEPSRSATCSDRGPRSFSLAQTSTTSTTTTQTTTSTRPATFTWGSGNGSSVTNISSSTSTAPQRTTNPGQVQNIFNLLDTVVGVGQPAIPAQTPSLQQRFDEAMARGEELDRRVREATATRLVSELHRLRESVGTTSATLSSSRTQTAPSLFFQQHSEVTPVNSRFADDDFVNDEEDIDTIMRRFNLLEESPSLSNPTISTTSTTSMTTTTSTTPVSNPTVVSSGSGISDDKKAAARRRLNEILSLGGNAKNKFDLVHDVTTFDLDALLRNYSENHSHRRLLELVNWAGGIDANRSRNLTDAIEEYNTNGSKGSGAKGGQARTYFSQLFSYFDKKKNQSGVTQETINNLKEQFRDFAGRIINANRGCIDQMLSQQQDMLLDIAVEDYNPTVGDRRLGKMLCRAGQELCKYKIDLLRAILHRLNPNQHHLVDLEREVMRRLAELMGLQGSAFHTGAQYASILGNVDDRVDAAVQAYLDEYHPMEYLLNDLSSTSSRMNKLRTELLQWAVENYDIINEDPDEIAETDLNPILSANFDPDSTRDNFSDGGAWSPVGALFLLEVAGFIQRK